MVAMPHKLLLADDSVTIQRVIELTFADEDVTVIAVGNGQAAIDSVQRDRPDIVLADVGMPERNGYEVAAFIKGNPALAHIPVVLLTGAFEPVDEVRARSVGCDGVLVKPFEPQIVISRVKDLLAGRQPSGMWGAGPVAQGPVRQAAPTGFESRPPAAGQSGDPLEAYFDHLDAAFNAGTPGGGGAEPAAPPPPVRREPIPISRIPVQAPQAAPRPTPNDPFADWDPDLMGDPSRPGPLEAPLAFPPRPDAPAPQAQESPAPPAPHREPTPAPPAAAPATAPVAAPAAAAPAPAAPVARAPAAPAAARVVPPSLVEAFAALLAAEQRIGLSPSAATTAPPGAPLAPAAPVITEELIESVTARVVARLTDQSRHTVLDAAERLVREEIERIKANQ
jgi:CheY-like chemotaxis protein